MKIEPKHLVWIFDAAGDHFSEKVAELESEIVRHEHFIHYHNEPLVRNSPVTKTRAQRLDEAKKALTEYRDLTLFCRDARLKTSAWPADVAKAFHAAFKL